MKTVQFVTSLIVGAFVAQSSFAGVAVSLYERINCLAGNSMYEISIKDGKLTSITEIDLANKSVEKLEVSGPLYLNTENAYVGRFNVQSDTVLTPKGTWLSLETKSFAGTKGYIQLEENKPDGFSRKMNCADGTRR